MTTVIKDPIQMASDPQTIEDVANTIRTARYGKDVREALAVGFEMFNEEYAKKQNKKIEELTQMVVDLQAEMKKRDEDWQNRIDRIVLGTDDMLVRKIVDQELSERGM